MSQHEFHAHEEIRYEVSSDSETHLLQKLPKTSGQMLSILFLLILPVFLEQILIIGVTFSDNFLTAKYLDTEYIAAISSAGYITWLMQCIFCFVSVGVTAMVARFCGEWNTRMASKVMNQALMIGMIFALAFFVFLLFYLNPMVDFLRLQGNAGGYAKTYLWIILPSLPFIMISCVGLAALRGAGNMVCGLWIMTVVNIVSVVISWGLVLGVGPLPRLGWEGVALGTTAGFTVGGLATLAVLWRGSYGLKLDLRQMLPDMNLIRRILWISVPGGLDMMTIIGCQFWFLGLINTLGVASSAAHGVALRVESFGFSPLVAFQLAIMTLVGQFLGAKRSDLAVRATYFTLGISLTFVSVMGFIFFAWAESLPFILLKYESVELAATVAELLRIIALAMPACALMMVLAGVLRGAGDTRFPLFISLFGFLCIRILGTYFLAFPEMHLRSLGITIPGMNLGVAGAWMAMTVDVWIRSLMLLGRFLYGKWKRIEV